MEILLETKEYLAVVKPADLVSEQVGDGTGLGDLLAERNGGYIGVIHRMDRGVGGATVYAKNRAAAARLSEDVREGRMKKTYLAVTEGIPDAPEGELRDLLFYDRKRNKVFVVDRKRNGVKEAILWYRVQKTALHPETGEPIALLEVHPITGRTHQIRVQFASRGLPLLGDRKYGGHGKSGISLVCHRIEIPAGGKNPAQVVSYDPMDAPWEWMR